MSTKKRKGLPPWAMQGHKSIGPHVWEYHDYIGKKPDCESSKRRCTKCLRPYRCLWIRHWNPRVHKTDACVRPSRPTTVTLRVLRRQLKAGAR